MQCNPHLKSPPPNSDLDGRIDEVLALLGVGDVADGPDRGDPLCLEPLHRLVHVLLQTPPPIRSTVKASREKPRRRHIEQAKQRK